MIAKNYISNKELSEGKKMKGRADLLLCLSGVEASVGPESWAGNRVARLDEFSPIGYLNFTPGPQGRISPLGVNSDPRGEIVP
jgi:hypothetical protein